MVDNFKIDRKSISEEVVEYLKSLIYQGKYKPGEKIPGEREMAQKINVSRNTVREAYKILEAQGYLHIRHGQGVFVADEDSQIHKLASSFFIKQDTMLELFSIRKILETEAIVWLVDNLTFQHQEELKQLMAAHLQALTNRIDFREQALLDQKFHLALARMSGNSVLLRIMIQLIDLLTEVRTKTIRIPGRAEQSLREHVQIANAILDKEKDLARERMLSHLNSVERSIKQQFARDGEENVEV